MKRYLLQHAESRALRIVDAPDFHTACHTVGWFPANTLLLRVVPLENDAHALQETPYAPSDSPTAAERRDS